LLKIATFGCFMLSRLSQNEWRELVLQWEDECARHGENFDEFAVASLPVLEELACSAPRRDAAVFGLSTGGLINVVCQANACFLPGYTGKVLRIRHIVLSPKFDFSDELELSDYEEALVGVFQGALGLAYGEMPSDHVKFHLKSPAERAFGAAFTEALKSVRHFSNVAIKGSWIYLSKA